MNTLYLQRVAIQPDPDAKGYPYDLPVIRSFRSWELRSPVTFLIGENGSGKSTLLEAVAVAYGFNPEGGSRNFRFKSKDTHSSLYRSVTLSKGPYRPKDSFFLRAESFYNVATEMERLYQEAPLSPSFLESYGGKLLHDQSHGEGFLALVKNRFRGGLYLLDEPESALSPTRQLTLLALMHQLVQNGSQFLAATHSPILLGYPGAEIYQIGEDGKMALTPYEQTEPYIVTRSFLQNPGRMLHNLLEEE